MVVGLLAGVGGQLAVGDVGGGGGGDLAVVLLVIFGLAVAVGAVLLVPKLRTKVLPAVRTTAHNLWTVFTSPRKVVYIFGGSVLTQVMYALILLACLRAYGADLSFGTVIFANTIVSLVSRLIPVPGGIGVVEAGLTATLTAFGVDPAIATAAVLTDRLITKYVPPVFGYLALNWLTAHDYV